MWGRGDDIRYSEKKKVTWDYILKYLARRTRNDIFERKQQKPDGRTDEKKLIRSGTGKIQRDLNVYGSNGQKRDWNGSLRPDYILQQRIYSLLCRKQGGILSCLIFLTGLLKLVETKFLNLGLKRSTQGKHQVWQNTTQCLPPGNGLGIATQPTAVTSMPKDTNL